MYADINRKNLDPKTTHFSDVLFHQGRVMLPSDLNEGGAIFQYYLRQFIVDFVGQYWRTPNSFEISDVDSKNFKISKGHFYINGILCVNEKDICWSSEKDGVVVLVQPMVPSPEWDDIKNVDLKAIPFAVYLECWERHVNSIQRPVIREVALGGLDTSSRLEIAWQVRVLTSELAKNYGVDITQALKNKNPPIDVSIITEITNKFQNFGNQLAPAATDSCEKGQALLETLDSAQPTLRVWAKKPADTIEPCTISPDSQYRGQENQLYRVEIHMPGVPSKTTKPSFKWSRENGSVAFKIITKNLKLSSGKIILDVETLGPDRRYGLCVNDWVELMSDEIEFGQKVLPLAQVEKIDSNLGRLTLAINTKAEIDFTGCTMLRRWDQNDRYNTINANGTIDILEASDDDYEKGKWILLEHGIKIQFQPGGNYRKGDYWLIPARVATGDVEWPKKEDSTPDARLPDGIKLDVQVFN